MSTICHPDTADWSCFGSEEEVAALDPATKARAEALAWTTLHSLTGQRIALCPSVIRPVSRRVTERTYYAAPVGARPFHPVVVNGEWFNGCSGSDCSCGLNVVLLPEEVGGIESILIDGAELPSTAYRVDNGTTLVRTDGGAWPICQDWSKSSGEGTFIVKAWLGVAPNSLLNFAAGVLASEFYKACTNKACRLPRGVRTVTRQGVTMEIESGMFENGYTGIFEVDSVIRTYNPHTLKARAQVVIPGGHATRRTTYGGR